MSSVHAVYSNVAWSFHSSLDPIAADGLNSLYTGAFDDFSALFTDSTFATLKRDTVSIIQQQVIATIMAYAVPTPELSHVTSLIHMCEISVRHPAGRCRFSNKLSVWRFLLPSINNNLPPWSSSFQRIVGISPPRRLHSDWSSISDNAADVEVTFDASDDDPAAAINLLVTTADEDDATDDPAVDADTDDDRDDTADVEVMFDDTDDDCDDATDAEDTIDDDDDDSVIHPSSTASYDEHQSHPTTADASAIPAATTVAAAAPTVASSPATFAATGATSLLELLLLLILLVLLRLVLPLVVLVLLLQLLSFMLLLQMLILVLLLPMPLPPLHPFLLLLESMLFLFLLFLLPMLQPSLHPVSYAATSIAYLRAPTCTTRPLCVITNTGSVSSYIRILPAWNPLQFFLWANTDSYSVLPPY